ncbi:MAG: prephenate dehydratase [Alphaproteobacteria bacterium]|nr:prephenate dehydratase [Alphaproteobacteria bacterium]MDD9919658.1 prephenate dehydratase [Alphaproteobacteria bacterium]
MTRKIAFQGALGAYTHMVVRKLFPEDSVVECTTFEDTFCAVEDGKADYAVIPFENSTAGRVPSCHQLFSHTQLHVIQEYYMPIHHCLLALSGVKIENIKQAYGHPHAIPQCAQTLKKLGITGVECTDTGVGAAMVADSQLQDTAAIASELAAELYGLDILQKNLQDVDGNTTRFLVLSPEPGLPSVSVPCKTVLFFQVRSIPAALYKALGGFATNGVNLTKLDSYLEGNTFKIARFFAEIEGHVDDPAVQRALEELRFFSEEVRILGTYERQDPIADK